MKESCWKRGSKKDAERIREAFKDLGACTCADYEKEDILYVLDGICGTLFMLPYESQTAEAIMDSHMFNELKLPIEPKFKVGDWLVYNDGNTFCLGKKEVQIQAVEKDSYIFTQDGSGFHKFIDDHCRLWSIADAKDGDVLATDNGWTCIFQAFDGCVFNSYCFMDSQKWFCESGAEGHTLDSRINGNIHPATKEQRDLLFAKMRKAGYKWDEKKKELRKIKPMFKVGHVIRWSNPETREINWHVVTEIDIENGIYKTKTCKSKDYEFKQENERFYELITTEQPKYYDGDLVVLDDLLGRITDPKYEDGMWIYRVGCKNTWNFDYELMKADHRDEHRILKGGGL